MFKSDSSLILRDIEGSQVRKGSFVELMESSPFMAPGSYRYEGTSQGLHHFSVGDYLFGLTTKLELPFKLLHWRKWKKIKARRRELESWTQAQRANIEPFLRGCGFECADIIVPEETIH